jgi:hypothetical protein
MDVSKRLYRACVEAWLKDEPYSWEKFFTEAQCYCISRGWREYDEEGEDTLFDNYSGGDFGVFFNTTCEAAFERNMKTLFSLPFPKKVVLLAASERGSVPEVCAICHYVRTKISIK